MPSPPDDERGGPPGTTPADRPSVEIAAAKQLLTVTVPRRRPGRARGVGATLGHRAAHAAPVLEPDYGPSAPVVNLDDHRDTALLAWKRACGHLADRGLLPLPPASVRRALLRRGWWR